MSNLFIWPARSLKLVTLLAVSTFIFIACADDQDATTTVPDSPVVKSDDPDATAAGSSAANRKGEPQDMHDSTVTLLALLPTEANQYRIGTQFITILQPAQTHNDSLTRRGFGRWYTLPLRTPFNQRNKERMILHVHGYLTYHDMVVKSPSARHTIFLKWHGQGANLDSVTVWISPAPEIQAFGLSDPPRPKVPPPPPME